MFKKDHIIIQDLRNTTMSTRGEIKLQKVTRMFAMTDH